MKTSIWREECKKFENYYCIIELNVEEFAKCSVSKTMKVGYFGKNWQEDYSNLFLAQRRFAQVVCGLII